MMVIVHYVSGYERSYENIISMDTSVSYNDGVPCYEITLFNRVSEHIACHEVKAFEVYHRDLEWEHYKGGMRCPKCGQVVKMYFDEFEAEISKNYAVEFDKRLNYVFKAPGILEKAWKMPFREDKEAYLRPIVCLAGLENLDKCIERSNDACMAILEAQGWFLRNKSFEKKDWRDFK